MPAAIGSPAPPGVYSAVTNYLDPYRDSVMKATVFQRSGGGNFCKDAETHLKMFLLNGTSFMLFNECFVNLILLEKISLKNANCFEKSDQIFMAIFIYYYVFIRHKGALLLSLR